MNWGIMMLLFILAAFALNNPVVTKSIGDTATQAVSGNGTVSPDELGKTAHKDITMPLWLLGAFVLLVLLLK